ncbi:MAG: hypothetical protein HDR03_12050 [Lachnospiraceae bacterium]|nr:hypothetical protein [Lachnospiraceae bacterium]
MNRINEFFGTQRNRIKDTFLSQKNRIAAAGVMALVWWCVFYPELCFPQDTYEVVDDEDDAEEEDFPDILQADDEQIIIGSRLLEWLDKKKN